MRSLYVIFALSLIPSISLADPASYNEEAVNERCASEWENDYQMREYCRNQTFKGYLGYLNIFTTLTENGDYFKPALERCENEWGQQWDMVEFCTNQQLEGVQEFSAILGNLPKQAGDTIFATCYSEWNPDFSMIAYCAKGQADSWHALND